MPHTQMTEDEYIDALTSIGDVNVRAVFLYLHQENVALKKELKEVHDETWILRQSWNVIRYLTPFLAILLGYLLRGI